MKFAKIVFFGAGTLGVLALTPLYFLFDTIARRDPPPITHPQFYYGFAGLGLVWQFAFFLIGADPARYRPMMIVAVLEKVSYVGALAVLYLQGRLNALEFMTGGPDALLGVLFVAAFVRTRPALAVRRVAHDSRT